MIRTPWNIPCPANDLRSKIKHSWFENKVLQYGPANIPARRRDGSLAREGYIEAFAEHLDLARELVRTMIDGFSPAQLVDRLEPLQYLSAEELGLLKEGVHRAYLERCDIEAVAQDLGRAVENLAAAFSRFRELWDEGGDAALEAAWVEILRLTEDLLEQFERLPQGVALP